MPSSMNWADGSNGGTPLSAANLNKLAVVADIPSAGTPTGDALRATFALSGGGVVDVKRDYGAKGDGTTNDRAAIQSALDNAATSGGQVFFPAGTYLIGGTLTVKGNVALTGAGSRCTTLRLANATSASLLVTPDDGVQRYGLQVRYLGFDGNAANQTGNAPLVAVRGMSETLWRDVYIINPRGSAIAYGQATAGMYCTVPIFDGVVVRGDKVNSQAHGIELNSGSSDSIISNCDIGYFSNGAGVLMSGHNGAQVNSTNCWQCLYGFQWYQSNRTRFTGCLSDYAKSHGYVFQECNDLQLTNCQARESSQTTANTGDGFRFVGPATGYSTNIAVSNCRGMGAQARVGLSLMSNLQQVQVVGGSMNGNAVAANVVGTGVTAYRFLAVAGIADATG